MTVYIAECATEHFTFRAVGYLEEHAREALVAAFDAHHEQYRKRPGSTMRKSWWKDGGYDIVVTEMRMGQGYRDGEPIGEHRPLRM